MRSEAVSPHNESGESEHHDHNIGPPMHTVDIILGTVLLLTCLLGSLGNLAAQKFFWNQSPRSANNAYFKLIYQTISAVDLVICITVFPVVEAFYRSPDDTLVLFGSAWFCNVWGFLWEILPTISVFLVGILSMSRLFLLQKPSLKLNRILFVVLFGVYVGGTAAAKLGLLLDQNDIDYWMIARYCIMVYDDPESKAVDLDFDANQLKITAVMMVQLALPIFPVTLSFALTMLILYRTQRTSRRANSSGDAQRKAATTVILVTLLYIILNLPVVAHFGMLLRCVLRNVHDICHYESLYPSRFAYYYIWPIMYVVCVTLNSTLNPCVYLYQMGKFRKFVRESVSASVGHENN